MIEEVSANHDGMHTEPANGHVYADRIKRFRAELSRPVRGDGDRNDDAVRRPEDSLARRIHVAVMTLGAVDDSAMSLSAIMQIRTRE